MKKYYLIFGVIVAIVVVAIIFAIYNRPQGDLGKPEPEIVLAPYVDVEATVSSLFLDDLYSDCEAPEVCPRDRVTLRMDKIDRTGDPTNSSTILNIGDQIEFHLKYSSRPTKLRSDIPPTCRQGEVFKSGSCVTEGREGPEGRVSPPNYAEKPAEIEGNYIVYHLPKRTDEVTEKILPGLEKGSKIKIRIWDPILMSKEIGEYEIIP